MMRLAMTSAITMCCVITAAACAAVIATAHFDTADTFVGGDGIVGGDDVIGGNTMNSGRRPSAARPTTSNAGAAADGDDSAATREARFHQQRKCARLIHGGSSVAKALIRVRATRTQLLVAAAAARRVSLAHHPLYLSVADAVVLQVKLLRLDLSGRATSMLLGAGALIFCARLLRLAFGDDGRFYGAFRAALIGHAAAAEHHHQREDEQHHRALRARASIDFYIRHVLPQRTAWLLRRVVVVTILACVLISLAALATWSDHARRCSTVPSFLLDDDGDGASAREIALRSLRSVVAKLRPVAPEITLVSILGESYRVVVAFGLLLIPIGTVLVAFAAMRRDAPKIDHDDVDGAHAIDFVDPFVRAR